jgi:hypothetical protein
VSARKDISMLTWSSGCRQALGLTATSKLTETGVGLQMVISASVCQPRPFWWSSFLVLHLGSSVLHLGLSASARPQHCTSALPASAHPQHCTSALSTSALHLGPVNLSSSSALHLSAASLSSYSVLHLGPVNLRTQHSTPALLASAMHLGFISLSSASALHLTFHTAPRPLWFSLELGSRSI